MPTLLTRVLAPRRAEGAVRTPPRTVRTAAGAYGEGRVTRKLRATRTMNVQAPPLGRYLRQSRALQLRRETGRVRSVVPKVVRVAMNEPRIVGKPNDGILDGGCE